MSELGLVQVICPVRLLVPADAVAKEGGWTITIMNLPDVISRRSKTSVSNVFQAKTYGHLPKDPPVIKIQWRVDSELAVKFCTGIRKRYGDYSEMPVFPRKRGRKKVRISKNYGRSKF